MEQQWEQKELGRKYFYIMLHSNVNLTDEHKAAMAFLKANGMEGELRDYVWLYVDEILQDGSSKEGVSCNKDFINKHISYKDGEIKFDILKNGEYDHTEILDEVYIDNFIARHKIEINEYGEEVDRWEIHNVQGMWIFNYKSHPGDEIKIRLRKVDEKGNPVLATNQIFEIIEEGTGKSLGKYDTNREGGYTKAIPIKAGTTYIAKEIEDPKTKDGKTYKKTDEYVKFQIRDDKTIGLFNKFDGKGNLITSENWKDENDPEGEFALTLEVKNEPTTTIKLKKVNEKDEPLQGAEFTIYDKDKNPIGPYATNQDGYALQNGSENISLQPGEYSIRETASPGDYAIVTEEVKVTIYEDGKADYSLPAETKEGDEPVQNKYWNCQELVEGVALVLTLTNEPGTPIKLKKVDEKDTPLSGAEFTIYEGENTEKVVGTYTTNLEKNTEGYALTKAGSDKIVLKPGTYTIKETKNPGGYIKVDETVTVTIHEDGTAEYSLPAETKEGDEPVQNEYWSREELDEDVALVLTLTNKPTTKIIPRKTDQGGKGLRGAKFKLLKWNEESKTYQPVDESERESDLLIDGYIRKPYELEPGQTYILMEEQEPADYELSTQYVKIVTKEDGTIDSWEIWDNKETKDNFDDDEKLGNDKKDEWAEETELTTTWDEVKDLKLDLILVLEDKPTTQIIPRKTDMEGNPIGGANFTLTEWDEENKQKVADTEKKSTSVESDAFNEGKEAGGYGNVGFAIKDGTTYIIEEQEPEPVGYQMSNQYAIIKFEEGEIKLLGVYEYAKDGEKRTTKGGKQVPEEQQDWALDTTEVTLDETTYVASITLKDKPKITIIPKKVEDGENEKPLKGATFLLSECDEDYNKIASSSSIPQTSTSTDTGFGSNTFAIEKDTYYIVEEVHEPFGYVKSNQALIIHVDKNEKIDVVKTIEKDEKTGKWNEVPSEKSAWELITEEEGKGEVNGKKYVAIVQLKDKPGITIKVQKTDGENPITDSVAVFLLFDEERKSVLGGPYTTNNGEVEIPLEVGKKYRLEEVFAPDGYMLTKDYAEIDVGDKEDGSDIKFKYCTEDDSSSRLWKDEEEETEDGRKIKVLKLTNILIPGVQIIKVDKETNNPISDPASFKIEGDGINEVLTTSGPEGKSNIVFVKDIKEDKSQYQITETANPSGYKKIEEDKEITLEITKIGNDITGAQIIKGSDIAEAKYDSNEKLITITIKNEKDKKQSPKELEMPLIMEISGKVWIDQKQGKNSEVNGTYDEGEELEGIEVKVYEDGEGDIEAKLADPKKIEDLLETDNDPKDKYGIRHTDPKHYMSDSMEQKLREYVEEANNTGDEKHIDSEGNFSLSVTHTDEKGMFSFKGLDPSKTYKVVFKYNGMRYSEIRASIWEKGCTVNKSVVDSMPTSENEYLAEEDKDQRAAITNMFKEIGPYPDNYVNGLVFTQTDVEKYEQNNELPEGVTEEQMQQFIKDTQITAKVEHLGGILKKVEDELKEYNGTLETCTKANAKGYIYPIAKYGIRSFTDIEEAEKFIYKPENHIVGYDVKATVNYNATGPANLIAQEIASIMASEGSYMWKNYQIRKLLHHTEYEELKAITRKFNARGTSYGINQDDDLTELYDKLFPETYTGENGITYSKGETTIEIEYYYIAEGYRKEDIDNNSYHTKFAIFNIEDYIEAVFDHIEFLEEDGEHIRYIKGWGLIYSEDIADYYVFENNLLDKPEYVNDLTAKEAIGYIYEYMCEKIEEYQPKEVDLCLVYRPTLDLGICNDVQRAEVTIDKQKATYIYDKRLSNGTKFQFGVNEFDLQTGRNVRGDPEAAYADYYQSLSDHKPDGGKTEINKEPYEDIGMRKEDVVINTSGEGSITTTGSAIAGFYNDYEVKIEIIYRVKLYNESNVFANVTNILDYYRDSFDFVGAYEDKECTKIISAGIDAPITVNGYKVTEIALGDIPLEENTNYEFFVKLNMTNPKSTLGGDVLDEGYETMNYVEINGYRTNIGVIDIDSTPGDLVPEGRIQDGPYDDDESKSPSLIFKNPEGASRKISGKVYEDFNGKAEIRAYTGESRDGDGYGDIPIVGAIVQLVETNESGSILGIRGQTLTNESGSYEFDKIVAKYYIVRFKYGGNYSTVLTEKNTNEGIDINKYSDREGGFINKPSYNGQAYENIKKTEVHSRYGKDYWYLNTQSGPSYAKDDEQRRKEVTQNFTNLTNERSEVLNSYEDKKPVIDLVNKLIDDGYMFADTDKMLLDVEFHPRYEDKIITTDDGKYEKTYDIKDVSFGIVERERAELTLKKKVSRISIVDSTGREITGGSYEDMKAGNIKYIKMIPNTEDDGIITEKGFVDMEIDKELLNGATLKIDYEITVTNTSETSGEIPNTIQNIQLIDYVSNNLNFGSGNGIWTPKTTQDVQGYLNQTSSSEDSEGANRIDLSTYQTILQATIDSLAVGEEKTLTLTLEKNLSSDEDSNFNFENQVEIVEAINNDGRGDYSSIYGNLDPLTYTSRQGNLNWDIIGTRNQNGYPQEETAETDDEFSGNKAIRKAEKDSGNAEEVMITPPTGTKHFVPQLQHYILALICLTSLATIIILMKKYLKIAKE